MLADRSFRAGHDINVVESCPGVDARTFSTQHVPKSTSDTVVTRRRLRHDLIISRAFLLLEESTDRAANGLEPYTTPITTSTASLGSRRRKGNLH